MGAWDTGPFDNDDALDLLDELGEVADNPNALADFLLETFDIDRDEVDASEGARAIAAAAWVATALPGAHDAGLALPKDVEAPDPSTALGDKAQALAALAVTAVAAAWASGSELRELWEEADPDDEARVKRHVQSLIEFLSANPGA